MTVAGSLSVGANDSISFSRINGWVLTKRYRGIHTEMAAIFNNNFRAAGVHEVAIEQHEDTSECSVTYNIPPAGITELAQETLDLDFEEKNGSIFFNSYFAAIAADPKKVASIKATADWVRTLNPDSDDISARITAATTAQHYSALEIEALNMLLFDQDTYEWLNPVLTFTRVVSPAFNTAMAIGDLDTIWTSAQVAAYLDARAILFAIPQVLNGVAGPGLPGWRAGWRKKGRFQWQADGKCQMVEVFIFGVYSPLYIDRTG
jgi:hypothetical protein